jgi:hypothetical protein
VDVFFILSSVVPIMGSQPGTNCIGRGFYNLTKQVVFSHALDLPKCCHCAGQIGWGTYGLIRLRMLNNCFILFLVFLSFAHTAFGGPDGLRLKRGIL